MSYQNGFGGGGYGMPQGGFPQGGYGSQGGAGGGGGGYGGRGRGRRDDRRGGRGGGGRGGYGGGDRDRPPPPESGSNRMRKMIIKFAEEDDFHPIEDPPRLARVLRKQWREGSSGISDGFRVGVTQEPHKHPHFVSLLTHLFRNPESASNQAEEEASAGEKRKAEDEEPECGREVVEDLSRAFRVWVEDRQWLNMRLCLNFFSLLVPAGLVTPASLLEVYRSLLMVLEEVGGGGDRAERVIRAVSEGLIRSGQALNEAFPEEVETLVGQLEAAIAARKEDKSLNEPLSPILAAGEEKETIPTQLDDLAAVLSNLRASGYAAPECLPRYWELIEEGSVPYVQSDPYHLVAVSMPPELYDLDETSENANVEGQAGRLSFFGAEVVAPVSTVNGWTLRSLVLDIVTLFEVNRKECARILLGLRTFITPGTFKSSNPEESTSTLSLESLIISTLLSSMLNLPSAPFPQVYYTSLIAELCKASPNTVAPPVGRAVRKMFGMMGSEGLDVEVIRRTADWFATHLSNFGFQWMWKEWIPDLELPTAHPKRAFMRRVVDLEIRLAYHDRILQTLPEPMLEEGAGVVSKDAPDPVWVYEQPDHPLHAEAVELIKMYRQKVPASEVRAHLFTLPNTTSGPGEPLPQSVGLMAVETLLHLGSRSFSHFLNATERYLDLLRSLGPDPASRQTILEAIGNYWQRSGQMRLVTIDKYIQYGVLEGEDVVEWVFGDDSKSGEEADGWTDGFKWEVLRMALEKHVGRVTAVRRRVRAVEQEDETARARKAAEKLERGEGVGEDEDVETAEARLERSKEARDAQISLDIQASKLESLLLTTMRHFVKELLPWKFDDTERQGLKLALTLLDSGEEGAWGARCRWGWYREFLRRYSKHLTALASVINDKTFAGIDGSVDSEDAASRAEGMVVGAWRELL